MLNEKFPSFQLEGKKTRINFTFKLSLFSFLPFATTHSEWNSAFKSTAIRNSWQRRYWKKALWLQQKTLVDYNWVISSQKSFKRSQYFSWQPGFTETNLQTLQNVLFWSPTNFPVAVYFCPPQKRHDSQCDLWRWLCPAVSSPLFLRCPRTLWYQTELPGGQEKARISFPECMLSFSFSNFLVKELTLLFCVSAGHFTYNIQNRDSAVQQKSS